MTNYFLTPTLDAEVDQLIHSTSLSTPVQDLPERTRDIIVLVGLLSQYLNGGLTQWVENGYEARESREVLDALGRIEDAALPGAHIAVREVRDIVGEVCRTVANDESDTDDDWALSEAAYARLDHLDTRLDAVQEAFRAEAGRYFAGEAAA